MARTINLLASALRGAQVSTATASQDATGYRDLVCLVNVSAAAGTTKTLDLKVQDSLDQTTWYDLVTVPTISGTGQFVERLGGVTSPFGPYLRGVYTIAGTGTPTFTFSLDFHMKTREAV